MDGLADMELQMQFIQTKARILTPNSSRKFATSWEYTRPEPYHIIHNLMV